jgi:sulfur carrier protein
MNPSPIPVLINQQSHLLPPGATLADAIAIVGIQPPFAAAINMEFVPRGQYPERILQNNDAIELIAPITGG